MISRIKTDREIIQEAARQLAVAHTDDEFDAACVDMVEALRYGRSIQWWDQWLWVAPKLDEMLDL